MPNHAHGIIVITESVGATHWVAPTTPTIARPTGPKRGSLGAIIGAYKSAVSYRSNKEYNATGIWQRNYYEHIIRSEREMDNIWRYIESNPAQWDDDQENPFAAQ
jgi:putative transposase